MHVGILEFSARLRPGRRAKDEGGGQVVVIPALEQYIAAADDFDRLILSHHFEVQRIACAPQLQRHATGADNHRRTEDRHGKTVLIPQFERICVPLRLPKEVHLRLFAPGVLLVGWYIL